MDLLLSVKDCSSTNALTRDLTCLLGLWKEFLCQWNIKWDDTQHLDAFKIILDFLNFRRSSDID